MFDAVTSLNMKRVQRHLLAVEDEHVIDLVEKHPIAYFKSSVWFLGAVAVRAIAGWLYPTFTSFLVLVGFGLLGKGLYDIFATMMDVFVITNMRVFRISGVLTVQIATMPITRILDITVYKPLAGRIIGYGHFIFESAAQAQGLRDIKYIGRPDERDLTIQRVVQRAGLRGRMSSLESDT